jgi:hypothetical protein
MSRALGRNCGTPEKSTRCVSQLGAPRVGSTHWAPHELVNRIGVLLSTTNFYLRRRMSGHLPRGNFHGTRLADFPLKIIERRIAWPSIC